jgi:hypothetical protein
LIAKQICNIFGGRKIHVEKNVTMGENIGKILPVVDKEIANRVELMRVLWRTAWPALFTV